MHTEAADFLGGLKPTRNRSECDVSILFVNMPEVVLYNACSQAIPIYVMFVHVFDAKLLFEINMDLNGHRLTSRSSFIQCP